MNETNTPPLERDIKSSRNLSMLLDFYELTMSNGYLKKGMGDTEVVFDMYFRNVPDRGGFAIAAGLEQAIQYINALSFSDEDIAFLRSKGIFAEEFLAYLKDFRFSCDVWAVPEGTPIFPNEPIVIVKGPVIQAQLIETMVLLTINHQSLIATKASRMARAAEGRGIMEFGSRRAQSYDAAMLGARAAYIGGAGATACVIADQYYGIPSTGTMAHSWIQLFDDEYEAFKVYAEIYPDSCTLLIDTYDVVRSGIVNAIKVFDNVLKPLGKRPKAIRLDSGDIAYLSKKVRVILDNAGYEDVKIIASNALNEYTIRELIRQGAQVDMFGVGENLITSRSEPVFGGVYKLVAVKEGDEFKPRIKISENPDKITTPGLKEVYRLYSKETGKAQADYITLKHEFVDDSEPLTIFDPLAIWKRKTLESFTARKLLVQVYKGGEQVYTSPTLEEIKAYCTAEIATLWDELTRFDNPHKYYVDLSETLWTMKTVMLNSHSIK